MISSLILNNINKKINKKNIIKDVSLYINSGEIIGLLGPNGTGKTTLFYIMVGTININSGYIFLNNKNITNNPIYKRAKYGINFLPQDSSIFENLSVEHNIKAILEIQNNINNNSNKYILNKLLHDFDLYKIRNVKGKNLSGGERRKVEIARCLSTNPLFILLDEPFSGIDPISIKDMRNVIKYLSYLNIGILITDHNFQEILNICTRSYIIINGKIVYHGSKKDILNNNLVKKKYLGYC